MAINKVIYGGDTIMDLTGDTVTAEDVRDGVTFHLANGVQATGTRTNGNYVLRYSPNSVGSAIVGKAVTEEPNYVPTGDIVFTNKDVTFLSSAMLSYLYSNYKLYISNLITTNGTISVPTKATFNGHDVHFIIEEEETE